MAAILIVVGFVACSSRADDSGADREAHDGLTTGANGDGTDGQTVEPEEGGEPEELTEPAEEVDYQNDAGLTLETYEYPDDPEPAEVVTSTLCNLNQGYFRSLRTESDDGAVLVNDGLRLSVLSVDDNLSIWESIRSHYPDSAEAIDTAWHIRDNWDQALLHAENGDETAAAEAMAQAEEQILNLPAQVGGRDVECQ